MAKLEQNSFSTFLSRNSLAFVTPSQFSNKKAGKPPDLNSSDQTEFCLPVFISKFNVFR
ncbi:hypothetical protein HOLDEFILI_03369 [Holdemania filiformis DSM 12042]|uniref:Uncharacterized protein n=1 Tax=Holdemania filiformis DSM 12042 TaxID=545696 RepID=B9YC12_9FIRM|nr:hypothetical protein HOLDEFILI_03369 [Holdemania filiformis DSM 12042]